MMDSVAHLYAHIMRFVQRAITWYSRGKLRRCWDVIARPWALRFKEERQEVERLSRQMDDLASAASKAELRDTHDELKRMRQTVFDMSQRQDRIMSICNRNFPRLVEFATSEFIQYLVRQRRY